MIRNDNLALLSEESANEIAFWFNAYNSMVAINGASVIQADGNIFLKLGDFDQSANPTVRVELIKAGSSDTFLSASRLNQLIHAYNRIMSSRGDGIVEPRISDGSACIVVADVDLSAVAGNSFKWGNYIQPVFEGGGVTAFSESIWRPMVDLSRALSNMRGINCDVYLSDGRFVLDLANSTRAGGGGGDGGPGDFPPYKPPYYPPPPRDFCIGAYDAFSFPTYGYALGSIKCSHSRNWTSLTYDFPYSTASVRSLHKVSASGIFTYRSFISLASANSVVGDDGLRYMTREMTTANGNFADTWSITLSRFTGEILSAVNYTLSGGFYTEDITGALGDSRIQKTDTGANLPVGLPIGIGDPGPIFQLGAYQNYPRLNNAADPDPYIIYSYENDSNVAYYQQEIENGDYSYYTTATVATFPDFGFYPIAGSGNWPSGSPYIWYQWQDFYVFRNKTAYQSSEFLDDSLYLLESGTKQVVNLFQKITTTTYDKFGAVSESTTSSGLNEAGTQSVVAAYRFQQNASGPYITEGVENRWGNEFGLTSAPVDCQLKESELNTTPSFSVDSTGVNIAATLDIRITTGAGGSISTTTLISPPYLAAEDTTTVFAIYSPFGGSGATCRISSWNYNPSFGYQPIALTLVTAGSGYTGGLPFTCRLDITGTRYFIAESKRFVVFTWTVEKGAKIRASGEMPAACTRLSAVEFSGDSVISAPKSCGFRKIKILDRYTVTGQCVATTSTEAVSQIDWPDYPIPTTPAWETNGGVNPAAYVGGSGTNLAWYHDEQNMKFKIYRNTVDVFGSATLINGEYTQNPLRRRVPLTAGGTEDGNYHFTYTDSTAGSSGLYYWIVAWFNAGVEATSVSQLST